MGDKMKDKKITTATTVAGVKFDSCVCNASGVKCTTLEELREIGRSDSCAIVMKSSTMEEIHWDDGPRSYYLGEHGMVQSNGLQNLGYETYVAFSKKLIKYGKPIIASVAGSSIDANVTMVTAYQKSTVDLIEVNISCPNIPGKSQVGYDSKQTEELLFALLNLGCKPMGLKLPPYFDPAHWDSMSELILRYNISFITCINSIGNVLVIDPWERRTVIKPKKGYAGLCGEWLEYIANANIRAFYDRLEGKVSIFGVGGVKDGISAFTKILAGADALQVGNAFRQGDHKIFSTIDQQLEGMLEFHGFSSIQEAKGQLLYI
jgi:dihydroorotate dehydrogenase (fumarate)